VLLGDSRETTTNEDGQFQLLNITAGRYVLKVCCTAGRFMLRSVVALEVYLVEVSCSPVVV
jgi:hypothetical protein